MKNTSSDGLRKGTKKVSKLERFPKYLKSQREQSPLSIQILYFVLVIYFLFALCTKVAVSFAENSKVVPIIISDTKVAPTAQILPNKGILEPKVEVKYDWKEDVRQKWGDKADIALAIAYAESGWNKDATGYNCRYGKVVKACKVQDRHLAISTDSGIFQIAKLHGYDEKTLHDPKENVRIAYDIYLREGFNAWYSYRNKKHLEFMP